MPQNNSAQALFTPATIGGRTVANRLALAPMTRCKAGPDRLVHPRTDARGLHRLSHLPAWRSSRG